MPYARLPKGQSSFAALRASNCVYVDKTATIAELAKNERFVFLSRPRRFGKSLLLSTFASLFEYGLRDFKGLAIEKNLERQNVSSRTSRFFFTLLPKGRERVSLCP